MRELFTEHNHEFKSLIQIHFGTQNTTPIVTSELKEADFPFYPI